MTDLTGNFLGPYRILEQIGHGGMATIYKAYQPAMDRLVAIKVLYPHSSRDQHVAERFEHEVLVIAGLEHRHIIPVYDFGRQGELLYLVMRYVRAGTVSDLIKRGPLHLVDAASLLSDIASALDYAHHLNIIHRDIKPNNILVDAEGRAYLTDFGLAKVMDESLELTLSGAAIGTPAYMAPEQVADQKVTPRTDIYAMGVMLYEMLTGQLPYQSESPMALAMMHLRDPLRPPQQVNPTIPVTVELVIKRAMSKNAADRYWTAGDMARDLTGAAAIHADDARAGSRLLDDQRWSGNIESPADNLVNNADRATLDFNAKPHLAQIANEIALAKSPDKITPEVRREIKNLERETRRQTVLARAPWITAGLLIIVLLVSLSFTISGLAQSRISADETATAVQLLLFQLSDAQTSIAKGDPGSQATLAYLQTQLASISITGTPPTTQPTSTLMTPTATPSATRPPSTYTHEAGEPGTDFISNAGAPTAQPSLVPTQPAPSAVATPPKSTPELPSVAGPPDEKLKDPKPTKKPKPTKVK